MIVVGFCVVGLLVGFKVGLKVGLELVGFDVGFAVEGFFVVGFRVGAWVNFWKLRASTQTISWPDESHPSLT